MSEPSVPVVLGIVGAWAGFLTIKTAWPLTFRICDWHHGLFMIAISFGLMGYGIGAWAQRPRKERDR